MSNLFLLNTIENLTQEELELLKQFELPIINIGDLKDLKKSERVLIVIFENDKANEEFHKKNEPLWNCAVYYKNNGEVDSKYSFYRVS